MLRIYETSLSVVRRLASVIVIIARRDPDLARQMRRAASSVVLNIAEGSYARGRGRAMLYNVALASAKETRACVEVAVAFGHLARVDECIDRELDSICAVLYRLTR
jgi:four helix bundle protein